MSPHDKRRIARRALKRSFANPVTHTGRPLHPAAALAASSGGSVFAADNYLLDPEGRVVAFPALDLYDLPRGYLSRLPAARLLLS